MKKKTYKIIICISLVVMLFTSFGNVFGATNPDYTPTINVSESALDEKIKGDILTDILANMLNTIASLAEYLIGAIFSALTGDNIFPWADRIIFNGIGFLDINFLNPAQNSLFVKDRSDSILGQVVKQVYSSIFSLAILFLGVAVGVMAIRLAISSIAAEKAKYKQAIVNWATCLVMLFLMHYILAFVFWINEQMVRVASGILIQSIENNKLNTVNFQEALNNVISPEDRVEEFIKIADNADSSYLDNFRDNVNITNSFLTSSKYTEERLVYVYDLGSWNDQVGNWFADNSANVREIGMPRLSCDVTDAAKISNLKETNRSEYDKQQERGYFDGGVNSLPIDNAGYAVQATIGKVRHIYIDEAAYRNSEDFRIDLAYYLVLMNRKGDGAETYKMYSGNPDKKITNGTNPTNWDVKVDIMSYISPTAATGGMALPYRILVELLENNETVDEVLARCTIDDLKKLVDSKAQAEVIEQRMKCDKWIYAAATNEGALNSSPTDIIASLGSFFKQSAYIYTTEEVTTGTGDTKEVVTGWRASKLSVTGALLYAIFIFQSCMYLIMYVKRLFYVMMLSMFGPIVVIYDFFMKSAS